MLIQGFQGALVAQPQRQRRRSEYLALGVWGELLQQQVKPLEAGDLQAVEMGLDPLVQVAEMGQVIMRRADGVAAQAGEEGGFFGVLAQQFNDHLGNVVPSYAVITPALTLAPGGEQYAVMGVQLAVGHGAELHIDGPWRKITVETV